MTTKNARKRKRTKLLTNPVGKDIQNNVIHSPPKKKRRQGLEISNKNTIPIHNNIPSSQSNSDNLTPSPAPQRKQQEEEEKLVETDHPIHTDRPTPSKPDNYNINNQTLLNNYKINSLSYFSTMLTQSNCQQQSHNDNMDLNMNPNGNDGGLSELMHSIRNVVTKKTKIISSLEYMNNNGLLPNDLKDQIKQYHQRKQLIKQQMNSNSKENPIKFTDEQNTSKEDALWSTNALIWTVFVLLIVICTVLCTSGPNVVFCDNYTPAADNDIDGDYNNTGCIVCPQNANCSNGIAICPDNWILYNIYSCYPSDVYNEQLRMDRLYIEAKNYLQYLRRRYKCGGTHIPYKLSKSQIVDYIRSKGEYFLNMKKSEINNGLNKLFENDFIIPDWVQRTPEGLFWVDIPESSQFMLIMRTYKFDLCVSVIFIAIFLICWRKSA